MTAMFKKKNEAIFSLKKNVYIAWKHYQQKLILCQKNQYAFHAMHIYDWSINKYN